MHNSIIFSVLSALSRPAITVVSPAYPNQNQPTINVVVQISWMLCAVVSPRSDGDHNTVALPHHHGIMVPPGMRHILNMLVLCTLLITHVGEQTRQ